MFKVRAFLRAGAAGFLYPFMDEGPSFDTETAATEFARSVSMNHNCATQVLQWSEASHEWTPRQGFEAGGK